MIWLLQHYWPLFMVCAVLGFFLTLAWMIRTVKVSRVESATVVPRQGSATGHTQRTSDKYGQKTTAVVSDVPRKQAGTRAAEAAASTTVNQTPTVVRTSPAHDDGSQGKQHLPNVPANTGRTDKVTDLRPFDNDRPSAKEQSGSRPSRTMSPSQRPKSPTDPDSSGKH